MDYMHKFNENPFQDLYWNLGEQTKETINLIGGNSQNFRMSVKIAEYMTSKYHVNIKVVLPDALKGKLPPFDNIIYMPSTDSGSFDNSDQFKELVSVADYNLLIGEFSKNSITEKAVASACDSKGKIVITRDGVDLLAGFRPEKSLMNENLIIFSSMPQLRFCTNLRWVFQLQLLRSMMAKFWFRRMDLPISFRLVKLATAHLQFGMGN